MKKRIGLFTLMGSLFLFNGVSSAADLAGMSLENFSATLTLTTDYVYRGQSFSGEDAAIQGSFDFSHGGFFAGVWGSSLKGVRGIRPRNIVAAVPSTEFDADNYEADTLMRLTGGVDCSAAMTLGACETAIDASTLTMPQKDAAIQELRNELSTIEGGAANDGFELELDFYVGYADSFAGIDWYVQPIYYWFPDADDVFGAETDQFEIWLGASHTLADDSATLSGFYAWSPDFTLEDGRSHYLYTNLAIPLAGDFSVDIGVGYQDVEGDKTTPAGYDYLHWDVGISLSKLGFDFDLRYYDTDEDDSLVAFWSGSQNIDARYVFSISRSF